jgi:acetylornithine deacetylase
MRRLGMEKSLLKRVDEVVDSKREEALTFLKDLVRFPTVVGSSYVEIQEYIAKKLSKMKLTVDKWCPTIEEMRRYKWWTVPEHYYPGGFEDKPVVVGTYKGRGRGRSLIFNGHVEVVTPEPLNLWKHDPWGGEVEEGRLYGRGSNDMKGGLAASILALECLQEIGVEVTGDVIIESVYDEEIGGTGTDAAILRGYRADGAIIPEPSNLNLTIACVGVMWFRVIIEGKSAHAAFVWDGINAIEKALKVHEVICAFGNDRMKSVRHPLFEADYPIHATFNPGTFSAGGYPSSVPDKAVLEYRIGLVPGEDNERVFERIQGIVKEASTRDVWLSSHPPKVELFGWYGKPTYISEDHPLTQSVASAYKEVTGRLPRYNAVTWCGDMWRLHHLANTPGLTLGCSGAGIHQNDEYIVIEDYFNLIKILALTIPNWCGCK